MKHTNEIRGFIKLCSSIKFRCGILTACALQTVAVIAHRLLYFLLGELLLSAVFNLEIFKIFLFFKVCCGL